MNIGIVGLGLIGGSMAKACKTNTSHTVYGADASESTVLAALLYKAIDGPLTDEEIALCDVILLCPYPKAVVDFMRANAGRLKPGALVVDCCGVKRHICAQMKELSAGHAFTFIGGHPMAGTQFSGFAASKADLFRGASMLLTPDPETGIETREFARDFFLSLGFGHVHFITPETHDQAIAYTSQLVHVVSNAYMKSPTDALAGEMSAGSYRDMTRVARLNAPMWTELFLENADNLGMELDMLIRHLTEYRDALREGDAGRLEELLRTEE